MKNIFTGLLMIGLCGIGAGYLISCAKLQSPVSPDTNLIGVGNSQAAEMPHVHIVDSTLLTSQALLIDFYTAMDPASLNSSTVKVYQMSDTVNTTETQYTGISISYDAALKRLKVAATVGWDDNRYYRVHLTTGVKSAAGRQLDGNGNRIPESSTFDNYNAQFGVGTPMSGIYMLSPINIANASIDAGGATDYSLTTGNVGEVSVSYGYVTITVTFDSDVDQSTVFVDTATMHTNFSLVNDVTGSPVSPVQVTMTSSSIIQGVFQLAGNTRYKLTVRGGASGIRSSNDAAQALLRGRYFGGEDTVAEAADDVIRYIYTMTDGDVSTAPPSVDGAGYNSGNRSFTINFNIPSGSGQMSAATLTAANLKLIGEYNSETYSIQPKRIVIGAYLASVEIYVPDSFYPASGTSTPNVNVRVKVSRKVMSTDGYSLDSDGDGVGGQEDDDYLTNWYSVDSQKEPGV
ncbi:Ig-like domain-containing protein [bacterium]|nr:Ig-like domain-containing protein [bacterium]